MRWIPMSDGNRLAGIRGQTSLVNHDCGAHQSLNFTERADRRRLLSCSAGIQHQLLALKHLGLCLMGSVQQLLHGNSDWRLRDRK